MQLYPTRATFHVALAGAAMLAIGVAARVAPVAAWGGAIILAVAVGRAFALAAVTRLRGSGFEMVWHTPKRVARTTRGEPVHLEAELRNRGVDDARGVTLRAVSSSFLDVTVTPSAVDLPAGARVRVDVVVRARRIGRWGVHGMALEVRGTPAGGEGLYEVPLMFANPFGVEVFPRALHTFVMTARGGRSRRIAETGRPAMLPGDGDELRELREHVPGDAFKRIAWKASARRGQLLVREMERDERDVVWLVLDASVELWAGGASAEKPAGADEAGPMLLRSPLDDGVELVAALAVRHLARGDHVGLVVTASRLRSWIPASTGASQAAKIAAAITSAASVIDADRSELDEYEVAQRVAEHLRPLDPRGLADVGRGNLDGLAQRAEELRARAPFAPRLPHARGSREQRLRHYLASFGIELAPRVDGEREQTETALAAALDRIAAEKKRPSIVHIWAPAPSAKSAVSTSVRRLKGRHVEVRWTLPGFEEGVRAALASDANATVANATHAAASEPAAESGRAGTATATALPMPVTVAQAVETAVLLRARAARVRGERAVRQIGATVLGRERRS